MSSPSKMAAPVPARPFGASKRKFEDFTEADESLKSQLTREISKSREKLKPKMSYDAEYFAKIADRSGLELQRLTLVRKQSKQAFYEEHGLDADWASSERSSRLDEEEQSLTLRKKLFEEQADTRKIKAGDRSKTLRRYFMQLYTSSQRDLGISPNIATMGQRDNSVQENFRKNLIQACGSAHEDENRTQLWCPVMGGYVQRESARAAHIFPYANGQEAMTSIFGEIDESKPEMNEIRNGLILSMWAEKRISDGDIVIIPLVSDNASQEEISKWAASDPKEYMIRIVKMSSTDRALWLECDNAQRRWGELDGAKVQFKSDHRPRSRYLYWQYCQTTLRQSWLGKNADRARALQPEFRKPYWGTKGSYMKRSMLLAFVEEMGHEYENLLDGAVDDTDTNGKDADPTALTVANQAIAESLRDRNKEGAGEDDEEDEEDEEAEDYRTWERSILE